MSQLISQHTVNLDHSISILNTLRSGQTPFLLPTTVTECKNRKQILTREIRARIHLANKIQREELKEKYQQKLDKADRAGQTALRNIMVAEET